MTKIVLPTSGADAVETVGLAKSFGMTRALDGLDLRVPAGTVYGLLGPNGAGKSTAIRILTTLLRPDEGVGRVLGFDVTRQAAEIRERIALTGQSASVDEDLTGRENLQILARLRGFDHRGARRRADELLSDFDLSAAARRTVQTYSGGMRRRLDIAASVIVIPELLFLDEPTTGLDPASRNQVWETIRQLVREGSTVLLTTQYLEEADRLAERVAVIDHGRVVAEGTTDHLKAELGRRTLRLRLADPAQRSLALNRLGAQADSRVKRDSDPATILVEIGADASAEVGMALAILAAAGVGIGDIALEEASLDDVFLSLTNSLSGQQVSAS
jgi:ABC-2 type transport system ATP-binding protein